MPFNPASTLARLIDAPVRPGRLVWIGLRPLRRAAMRAVQEAELEMGAGLVGDHYRSPGGARQVTLIQAEGLATIASHLGHDLVRAEVLRRNMVVAGINLLALKGRRFRIGPAWLEASGDCHPCSRMEEALGSGGYNAVRGQGGITARVLRGGRIEIGDRVEPVVSMEDDSVEGAVAAGPTGRQ